MKSFYSFAIPLLLIFVILQTSCSPKLTEEYFKVPETAINKKTQSSDICGNRLLYAGDSTNIHRLPQRNIRVNFHIVGDENGDHNFSEETGDAYVHRMLNRLNEKMANNVKMYLPHENETPVLPTRIQYVLDTDDPDNPSGIYYHRENTYTNAFFFNKKPFDNRFSRHWYNTYGVRKDTTINIFLLSHPPDSLSSETYRSKSQGVGLPNFVLVASCYHKSIDTFYNEDGSIFVKGPEYMANLLAHELGHSLGLAHTWNSEDGCNDTPKNPGCWNFSDSGPCKSTVSNNMMDYNAYQSALTPCQIGRMHYNLSFPRSHQRRKLVQDWCHLDPKKTVKIKEDEHWLIPMDIYGNIIIRSGNTLRVHCRVSIPKDGKIIVEPGAELIIDGGLLTNTCNDYWDGIIVQSDKTGTGKITFLNNGGVKHARNY